MILKKIAVFLSVVFFTVIIFLQPIAANFKAVLLISQEFPQIPAKPLHSITKSPTRLKIELNSENGKIVADLFVPNSGSKPKPALILAMGVKTQEKDKPIVLGFADTLSRLGYVVFWPRLEILDQGTPLPEEPQKFIESFNYLEKHPAVDPERISMIGFSVGSSIALVASANPQIRSKVRSLVFYGGYYDIFDYLTSLATNSMVIKEKSIPWEPSEGATSHAKDILVAKNATSLLRIFEDTQNVQTILKSAPQEELNQLQKLNPADQIKNFRTQTFILHDKSDTYVPYVESTKLNNNLKTSKTFLLVNLFEHVQPKKTFDPSMLPEFFKLYRFITKALDYF